MCVVTVPSKPTGEHRLGRRQARREAFLEQGRLLLEVAR
jgi:hypothetical protein